MFIRIQIGGKIVNGYKHLSELVFLDTQGQFSLLDAAMQLRVGLPENFSGGDEADSLLRMKHRPDPGAA